MIISLKIKEKLLAKPSHLLLLNIIRDPNQPVALKSFDH